MAWVELSIDVLREDEEVVADLLRPVAYGGVAVEEGYLAAPWEADGRAPALLVTVKAYFPLDDEAPAKEQAVQEGVRRLSVAFAPLPLRRRVLDEEDWATAWKVHFSPIPVGERLLVVPAWLSPPEHSNRLPLFLDPGLAFGTGQHASTRMVLALMERHLRSGDRVLDWGTGSGILAIAAVRLGAASVLALDTDSIAVKAARDNLARNQVEDRVTVQESGLEETPPEVTYDLILANITYAVLSEGARDLWRRLGPNGRAICSGLLRWTRDQLATELEALGAEVLERCDEGEWGALAVRAPTTEGR